MKRTTEQGNYCQVHRFWEKIAVYVGGKTCYMSPDEAIKLANGILAHANDAKITTFGKSTVPTFELKISNGEL